MRLHRIAAGLAGAIALLATSATVSATERMYALAGLGGGEVDYSDTSSNGISYRLGLGHQFQRQWAIELGYQNLVDDEASGLGEGLSAEALTLSLLGKAANQAGELFYRIGVANIDVAGQALTDANGECVAGGVIGAVPDVGTFCGFDEGVIGGIVGLGFDFHVGLRTMVRIEAEYLAGEEDYSTAAIYAGIRFNFN